MDNNWSSNIINLYTEGGSDAEVAAFLRVPMKKFYKQMDDNSAFKELIEFGRTLSQAWWEGQFRRNVHNKNYNSALLSFYMKNKHGWADKVDTTSSTESTNITLDEARAIANKKVADFLKKNTPELTDAQRVLKGIGAEIAAE